MEKPASRDSARPFRHIRRHPNCMQIIKANPMTERMQLEIWNSLSWIRAQSNVHLLSHDSLFSNCKVTKSKWINLSLLLHSSVFNWLAMVEPIDDQSPAGTASFSVRRIFSTWSFEFLVGYFRPVESFTPCCCDATERLFHYFSQGILLVALSQAFLCIRTKCT